MTKEADTVHLISSSTSVKNLLTFGEYFIGEYPGSEPSLKQEEWLNSRVGGPTVEDVLNMTMRELAKVIHPMEFEKLARQLQKDEHYNGPIYLQAPDSFFAKIFPIDRVVDRKLKDF